MRDWVIKKLGGFTREEATTHTEDELSRYKDTHRITTEDCLEHIESIDNLEEKNRVLTLAVQHMFHVVDAEDILRKNPDGSWSYGNRILNEENVRALQSAMDNFSKSQLYRVLKADLKYHATTMVALKSRTIDDVVAGKLLLYYIDIVDTRLKRTLIKKS